MDRQPERERRALPDLALDANVALEELREPARDREPSPVPRCIESPRGPAFTCSNSSKILT
jgi:hypothetical protein